LAIIEMKKWLSETGEKEIQGIERDIRKLTEVSVSAFMILFSANPAKQTEENLQFLYERLPELRGCPMKLYAFPTVNSAALQCDFWIAGWQLR